MGSKSVVNLITLPWVRSSLLSSYGYFGLLYRIRLAILSGGFCFVSLISAGVRVSFRLAWGLCRVD